MGTFVVRFDADRVSKEKIVDIINYLEVPATVTFENDICEVCGHEYPRHWRNCKKFWAEIQKEKL